MNCPYCNKPCERLRKYDWVCDNCPVTAIFSDWNEYEASTHYLSQSSSFMEVSFSLKSVWIDFYPNTEEIVICYHKPIKIKVNCLITPANVQEIYNRIINMRSFL